MDKKIKPTRKQVVKTRRRLHRNRKKRIVRRILESDSVQQPLSDLKLSDVQPTDFRRYKQPKILLSALQAYHKHVRDQYLMGLVHPDIAVRNGIPIKLPSDMPIPTASIGYHQQYQSFANSSGNFLISWRPCFMTTTNGLVAPTLATSNITFNNSASLNGTTVVAGNNFLDMSVYPAVNVQKYRLVSALMKVSYNGSVLNQAGTMLACATFDPLVVAAGNSTTNISTVADPNVDRFGQFSLIMNGLWNKSVNITANSEGLECLYVPMDPDDYIFNSMGRYYDSPPVTGAGTFSPGTEGAHINYIVAGRNFPATVNNIIIDIYSNYEVIADPSSAYVLRSNTDLVYDHSDKDKMAQEFNNISKNGGFIKAIRSIDWGNALAKVAKTGLAYLSNALLA